MRHRSGAAYAGGTRRRGGGPGICGGAAGVDKHLRAAMSGAAGKMVVSHQITLPAPRPPASKLGDCGWTLDVPNGKVSIDAPAPAVTSAIAGHHHTHCSIVLRTY